MTRFEKDLKDALEGNEIEVLTKRKAELDRLEREGKACRNTFRRQCIAQDFYRLKKEYEQIEERF